MAAEAFGNALGGAFVDNMRAPGQQANPASAYGYVNGMDLASDNFNPASLPGYRNGMDIQSDNATAQRQRDALYGLGDGNSGLGFNASGGVGLRYGNMRALGNSDNSAYLSEETQKRLISGQTVLDIGDPYAVGVGEPGADSVGALRRLANALPNVKSGFFTDNFVNKALNSDVPVLQRQFYGATLPLVAVEQMGIGLINAPGRIVSALDNLTGIVTQPTAEGKFIAGLTALRDGSEGLLGLMPLIPASRLTAPIQFGRSAAAEMELVMPGRMAANPMEHEAAVVDYLQNTPGYGTVGGQVHLKVTLQDGTSFKIIPDALEKLESGAYRIHDAKFGWDGKDMMNTEIALSRRQTPAFPEIANGTAQIEIANSQAGKQFFRGDFQVGRSITIDPQIKIYVNTPQGIAVRTNPFNH